MGSRLRVIKRTSMKKIALSVVKDDLSKYLRLAAKEDVVMANQREFLSVLSPRMIGSTFGSKTIQDFRNELPRHAKAYALVEGFVWKM